MEFFKPKPEKIKTEIMSFRIPVDIIDRIKSIREFSETYNLEFNLTQIIIDGLKTICDDAEKDITNFHASQNQNFGLSEKYNVPCFTDRNTDVLRAVQDE